MRRRESAYAVWQEPVHRGKMIRVNQGFFSGSEPSSMNVPLTDELKLFVQKKVATGAFRTEQDVVLEAIRRFWREDQAYEHAGLGESTSVDDLIDDEAVASCQDDADDSVTLDHVRAATSMIKDSMARVVVEQERAERL